MAIAIVQRVNLGYVGGGGNLSGSFPNPVTAGNAVFVGIAVGGFLGSEDVTTADNHGNTYTERRGPNNNDMKAGISYAWNVTGGNPFTITLTRTGSVFQETMAAAIEVSGLGTVDPIVGLATAAVDGVSPGATTAALGTPEALVIGVVSARNITFSVTGITVGADTPTWTEEAEHDSACTTCMAGEVDTRIVPNGNAQSIGWTIAPGPGGNNSVIIAAFYGTPPAGDLKLTQFPRETLEQDGTVSIHLTQFAREVLYPFTCVPGPSNTPATGCPAVDFGITPVTGRSGCTDEV